MKQRVPPVSSRLLRAVFLRTRPALDWTGSYVLPPCFKVARGGAVICRGGECSSECETSPGSCKIIMTLAPFGITLDDRIMEDWVSEGPWR